MKIGSGGNVIADSRRAAEAAADELSREIGRCPHFIFAQMNAALDATVIRNVLRRRFPKAHIHGATSCCGTMTEKGVYITQEAGLALLGIYDEYGSYGSCLRELGDECSGAVVALDGALAAALRLGESPEMIVMSCCPGREEAVLAALRSRIGPDIPIIGGSAADDRFFSGWSMFDRERVSGTGCLLSVFFSSLAMGHSFQCSYLPTDRQAVITAAHGRILEELDGRPAADVYLGWLGLERLMPKHGDVTIHRETALNPLGRLTGRLGGIEMFILSRPVTISASGHLELLTEVRQGETVRLMAGNTEMLIDRAARVCAFAAKMSGDEDAGQVSGAIIVFCAGCMLLVRQHVEDLRERIRIALGGAPFITAFTFGEQGQVVPGVSCHGNLMISSLVWRKNNGRTGKAG